MEFHLWLSLVLICILGALSPGPSLVVVIKNTLSGGKSSGYATAVSHGFGVALYAAITATGIGLVITKSPVIYTSIQYAGAIFLVYLGVKSLLSKKSTLDLTQANSQELAQSSSNSDVNASPRKSIVNGFRDGFLIAFLNPKLALFFLALFSQFVTENASGLQNIIMTATVGIIDALWYCLVTFMLTRGKMIERLKSNSHIIDKIAGVFLILLATRVVLN